VVFDRALRYLVSSFNIRQLQHYTGTTRQVYNSWCKASNIAVNMEEIGENTKLLWLGDRGLDKVIVYLHGK
jgi:hypothetical protein